LFLLLLPVSTTFRKITSLFFILLGFVPMLFVLVFVIKQQNVRNRMKERLEQEMLHTIVIAENEFHWTEEGKEIFVHGRMFDVKSIEHFNGRVIVRGLYDDEETALNKSFNESWKKKSSHQRQLLAQLFQSLRGFYCDAMPDFLAQAYPLKELNDTSSPKLITQFKLILTPPPRRTVLS
jgi:hypothetical protein